MTAPSERVHFPSTHWSILKTQTSRKGLEALARMYWKPVYAHIRFKWNKTREQAEDCTQDFFSWILQGPLLDRAEPHHGRFRNFVRAHIDNFMRNEIRAGKRLKRGGGRKILSLDFGEDPDSLIADSRELPPEEILDDQWKRTVLDEAIARLKHDLEKEGRSKVFETFRRYDLAAPRPSYTKLAEELGVPAHDIDNHLSQARKRLYQHAKDVVAETVDGPDALRDEISSFFSTPSSAPPASRGDTDSAPKASKPVPPSPDPPPPSS